MVSEFDKWDQSVAGFTENTQSKEVLTWARAYVLVSLMAGRWRRRPVMVST